VNCFGAIIESLIIVAEYAVGTEVDRKDLPQMHAFDIFASVSVSSCSLIVLFGLYPYIRF